MTMDLLINHDDLLNHCKHHKIRSVTTIMTYDRNVQAPSGPLVKDYLHCILAKPWKTDLKKQ